MKKTITILFFVSAVIAGAEDFNLSGEKGSNAPSEKPRQDDGGIPVAAQPALKQPATVKIDASAPVIPKTDTEALPAEIENLSGGVPKADTVKPETVAPPALPVPSQSNQLSEPAVVPQAAEVPAPFAEVKPQPSTPATSVLPGKAAGGGTTPGALKPELSSGINAKAYDELIKENLDLHKKIAESQQDKDLIKQENQRLGREIKDLEQKIADSVGKIKDLGKQKEASVGSPAQMKALEDRMNKAEQEKALLSSQLAAMQKKITEQTVAQPDKSREAVAGRTAEPVKVGSDLYQKLENENMILRQKLVDLDLERQKAIKAREDTEKLGKLSTADARRAIEAQKQIKNKLDEVKTVDRKQKKIIVDLATRIPEMEKELAALQKKLSDKDVLLKEKDKNLEAFSSEIQQRENRIRKVEKKLELMEQAQRDVGQVSDNEKRDMHYNMAAVYFQTGKYLDAEREYLRALQLDPTDADVHYNLGILYDENLKEKQKAAMHYRRYLKLKPGGADADAVKNWLTSIEVKP